MLDYAPGPAARCPSLGPWPEMDHSRPGLCIFYSISSGADGMNLRCFRSPPIGRLHDKCLSLKQSTLGFQPPMSACPYREQRSRYVVTLSCSAASAAIVGPEGRPNMAYFTERERSALGGSINERAERKHRGSARDDF